MLSDPRRDAQDQLAALRTLADQLDVWRGRFPELAAWWSAVEAVLAQSITEISLGLDEGEDAARRDFLTLAEILARAATLALARVQRGGDLNTRLRVSPLFSAHLNAWHALRGARQNVSWLGARGWVSGRQPLLALTADGTEYLARLAIDPLPAAVLSWWDATKILNALAAGLRWRA
jgi:hypothetical protein